MKIYVCDPFGRSDPDSIVSYGEANTTQLNYTFFFDQEPINLARHIQTFRKVKSYATDTSMPITGSYLVTSEKDSDIVDYICKRFEWKKLYYFFHGWAALDWYRGYNKTYLMPEPKDRKITKTFIAPNRIVAGEREHRLIMLYHIFKYEMTYNWISCPEVCPAENIKVIDAVKKLKNQYSDIEEVFSKQTLPIDFPNETGHPMKSCWLDLFNESAESLLYLVTETVATGKRLHLTEKTFKPICLRMPFIIVGTCGSLAYLRSYGFKTFNDLWDESYDDEIHDNQRIEKITWVLRGLDSAPVEEKQRLFDLAKEICEYNYNHFYNGGFEKILWNELQGMLSEF